LKTQNHGVFGSFGTNSYASSSDNRPIFASVPYYGKLVDIIELNYHGQFMLTMFKCKWANTTTSLGRRKDALGFEQVNFSRLIHTGELEHHEPYIRATEAKMVFYVQDCVDRDWCIPVHLKPRDLYDMGDSEELSHENEPLPQQQFDALFPDEVDVPLARQVREDEVSIARGARGDEVPIARGARGDEVPIIDDNDQHIVT
jgi:Domain of unknown function (DUF4216)